MGAASKRRPRLLPAIGRWAARSPLSRRTRRELNVCFLIQDLGLAGGVGVVLEHAHHLQADHGMDVTLVRTVPSEDAWKYERLQGLELLPLDAARERHFDVAVATWWETAYELFSLDAGRYAYFVQSMEDRFYRSGDVHRLLAAATQNLPVSFITEARWIALLLRELNHNAHVFLVRNGVTKDVFPVPDALSISRTEPLRVLIEGHPGVWFKGIDDALAAVSEMREPAVTTVVSPVPWKFDSSERILGPITPRELSAIYAETDVVLKLSRVEGMFGPPLEGFHRGASCIVTPVTGHEEYVVHGWNGIVADWDDIRGTGRWLDILARDRRLLHFLRFNALATARSWPSWRQSTQFMAAALRRISALPPPSSGRDVLPLLRDLRGGVIDVEVTHAFARRHAAATGKGQVSKLRQELDLRNRELHELQATRAYRLAIAMRASWKHPIVRVLSSPFRLLYRATARRR